MAYNFILEDLAGNALSEVPGAKVKTFALPMASLATAGFTVPLDHPDADFLLAGDALLKVIDTGDRDTDGRITQFHGRLVTAEEVGDSTTGGGPGTVACTFADPFWTLLRRLIGKSKTGYTLGTALAPVDRGAIITDMVTTTNAESPSGVVMGNVTASSSTFYGPVYSKRIAEAIAELSATLDGPDWRVRPTDYVPSTVAGLGSYGALDVAPVLGQARADAAFEYGDGLLNVAKYRRLVSLEGTLNRPWHLPSGYPDNTTQGPLSVDDAASQATRGLLEDVVTGDVGPDPLRLLLLAHHLAVRKGPRQTISFDTVRDPSGLRVPRLGREFNVGDTVPFRASYTSRAGAIVKRLNTTVRIYQAAVNVDDVGVGTLALTVAPT